MCVRAYLCVFAHVFARVCVCMSVCECVRVCVRMCVYVFVGGKEKGERVFKIAESVCQRLRAHSFPSECAGFA